MHTVPEGDALPLLFSALADPARLRILAMLSGGELCVGDLITLLDVPQPTASRHLSRLKLAGLLSVRKSAGWSFYSVTPAEGPVRTAALALVRASTAQSPELKRDRARADSLRRKGGCCPGIARRA